MQAPLVYILLAFSLVSVAHTAAVGRGKPKIFPVMKKSAPAPSAKLEPLDVRGGRWVHLNPLHPVCFETRGDRPGHFIHLGRSGLMGAIKLVWRSGFVRCVSNPAHDSRWGCYHHPSFINYPLNIIITDEYKNIIFPKARDIKHTAGLWYSLPMVDDKYTDELVFADFSEPLFIQRHRAIKIWYGEDFKNWSEGDNQGRACVDVYGRFM